MRCRVLHVIRIPLDQPLNAELIDAEEQAEASLAEAQLLAEEQGIPIKVEIVRSRSIGETVVHEAKEHDVDLIVMGSAPRWRRQSRFFSPTVDFVLRKAPCEVMVIAYPQGVLEEEDPPHRCNLSGHEGDCHWLRPRGVVRREEAHESWLGRRRDRRERRGPRKAWRPLDRRLRRRARHGRERPARGRDRGRGRGRGRDERRQHEHRRRPGRPEALRDRMHGRAHPRPGAGRALLDARPADGLPTSNAIEVLSEAVKSCVVRPAQAPAAAS